MSASFISLHKLFQVKEYICYRKFRLFVVLEFSVLVLMDIITDFLYFHSGIKQKHNLIECDDMLIISQVVEITNVSLSCDWLHLCTIITHSAISAYKEQNNDDAIFYNWLISVKRFWSFCNGKWKVVKNSAKVICKFFWEIHRNFFYLKKFKLTLVISCSSKGMWWMNHWSYEASWNSWNKSQWQNGELSWAVCFLFLLIAVILISVFHVCCLLAACPDKVCVIYSCNVI